MANTPNVGLPTMDPNVLQPSIPFNTAMQLLDAVAQIVVVATANTPPSTTASDVGKVYLIDSAPTGAWAGRAGQLALCTAPSLWAYLTPRVGWYADIGGGLKRLSSSGWVTVGGSSGDYVNRAGDTMTGQLNAPKVYSSGDLVAVLTAYAQQFQARFAKGQDGQADQIEGWLLQTVDADGNSLGGIYVNASGLSLVNNKGGIWNQAQLLNNGQILLNGWEPQGRNLLINAEMQINQRMFAGGALAAGVYGYDRWKAGSGGCNVSVDGSGLITHTSGPLVQIVKKPSGVYGGNVTLSVQDPSGTINVSVGGVTGVITAGSGRRSVTLAIPSSGSGNLTVQLTATNVTYRLPQLERGSAASAFDYRPEPVEMEYCKRYYEKSYPEAVKAGTATAEGYVNWFFNLSGNAMSYMVPFQVTKAGTPAVTLYSHETGAAGKVRDVQAGVDVEARVGGQGPAGFRNYFVPNSSPTSLNVGHQWVAEAEL
ncbi:hypothetical protein NB717_000029 [Xanthomonas sacchari]|uniref:DUF2793 domain-containing protein n=1 Tax=Xanthomonas sacchari TaxID=56458 RepID=UPI00225DD6C6|nr:DUF2793 domain-containing protein [Xanthomonas sacchari]MCW0458961.1 hypothetical protein [Xanthomonas sacchari]